MLFRFKIETNLNAVSEIKVQMLKGIKLRYVKHLFGAFYLFLVESRLGQSKNGRPALSCPQWLRAVKESFYHMEVQNMFLSNKKAQ